MTYLEALVSKTSKVVERWHGRQASMLELTKSHATMSVVVLGQEYGQNLVIACLSPEYICGPTNWSDSEIRISVVQLTAGAEGIALIDEKNGVRITAESFEVKENVKF
jgi:hypothetical protein